MKHVIIFDKDEYDAICCIIRDASEYARNCPDSYCTNKVIDKLEQVQKMLKEEK